MAATVQLKKILEWELSLDARDLRSHAWYHGSISRATAEQIVGDGDGDFLVRDCTSQPGNYVLSCRSRGQNLHFVINKMVLQANTVYETVQYRFEDDGFDTVPDLITYYVGSGKPITIASAAKIQNPRNRRHPLSFYNADAGAASSLEARSWQQITPATAATETATPGSALFESPPATRRRDSFAGVVPATTSAKHRSLSLRPGDVDVLVVAAAATSAAGSADFDVKTQPTISYRRNSNSNSSVDRYSFGTSTWLPKSWNCWTSTGTDSRSQSGSIAPSNAKAVVSGPDSVSGSGFDHGPYANVREPVDLHHYSPPLRKDYATASDDRDGNDGVVVEAAPPKPSRRRIAVWQQSAATLRASSSSDSGNGSDDSAQSCNAAGAAADVLKATSEVVIKNPKYEYYDADNQVDGSSHRSNRDYDRDVSLDGSPATDVNDISYGLIRMSVDQPAATPSESASAFDLDNFHTLLLPVVENKPLDTSALQSVHMLLMDSGSRILANHLTRADLELTVRDFTDGRQAPDSDSDSGSGAACNTGIELCFLPQGRRHRYDLIERSECLRLLVAVTILTCATESERAQLLNKWIQVAIDTKTALGNLYGFCGIMLGLCTPQVLRLNETWHILRQRYTDSAFNFEAKLRPTLKCMNESTNPLAPNTTIPHLLPAILLHETNYPRNLVCKDRTDCGGDDGIHIQQDEDELCHILTSNSHLWEVSVNQWEACSPDLGLSTLYSHLNASRQFYNLLPTFRRNAEIVLTDSKIDQLLCDLFRTEFHMKFLWGSRGAKVNASERYTKFQQVLNVMTQKCETIDNDDNDADAAFVFTRSDDWYGNYVTDGPATAAISD